MGWTIESKEELRWNIAALILCAVVALLTGAAAVTNVLTSGEALRDDFGVMFLFGLTLTGTIVLGVKTLRKK
tara:strand:+ start:921 stop:1136 length:216 start_codon:yes stop_codon:yes gene_type:complete